MKMDLRDEFSRLADHALGKLEGSEAMRLSFNGERSHFVRLNNAAIRQPGTVEQEHLTVELIDGKRHSSGRIALSGEPSADDARVDDLIESLRAQAGMLPEDPHLILPDEPRSVEQIGEDRLPSAEQAVADVLDAASGTDLVGIYASGGIYEGFASSFGQRSWFGSYSFNLDFSLYAHGDKAVKESLAGFEWNGTSLQRKLAAAKEHLEVLRRPVKDISPGRYDVYISPAALEEIVGLLSWNGFGLRSHKSKTTSLLSLLEGEASLSPKVTITESTEDGVGPSFDDAGFVKPPKVVLIADGKPAGALVSPRSAVEYGVPTNAASPGEHPFALDMAPGDIPLSEVTRRLGEGIYIGNLWYLNYSDQKSCRMTGMTRFGTFWVEDGRITAPLPAMRFDESLYRMLGENLEGLTKERDLILDPSTYFARSTRSSRLPGALVRGFTLTL